jgi:penicillin-binding protein 1A
MGYCAETLGGLEDGVSPLEMASAYATIANGGSRNRPRVIRKVTTREGRSELPKRWRVHRTKAFSDGVTYEATKILEANMRGGTGTHAQIGCPAAGKTGTTDKNIDAWFVGFTPKLSTAVWVGYPNSNKISMNGLYFGRNVDGGTYPADIWGHYMKKAVGRSCGDFERPTEPFQSQPFFGHYARSGRDDDDDDQGSGQTSPSAPQEQEGPTRSRARPSRATARATATAGATTAQAEAAGTRSRPRRTATRRSTRTSTRHRRSRPRKPRPRAAARKRHRATADSGLPDWYNLRRQGRPRGGRWL